MDVRWISRSLENQYRELLHFGQADAAVDVTEMFGVVRSEDCRSRLCWRTCNRCGVVASVHLAAQSKGKFTGQLGEIRVIIDVS